MQPFELFSAQGAYVMRNDKPLYASVQFIIPDVPSKAECGAVLELVGRLTFESLFVPEDVVFSWCCDEERFQGKCRVLIGESEVWLREQLTGCTFCLLDHLAGLSAGQGIVGACRIENGDTLFIIAGADAVGLIEAARALAAADLFLDHSSPSRVREDFQFVVVDGISARSATIAKKSPSLYMGGSLHLITEINGLYEKQEDGWDRVFTGRLYLCRGSREMLYAAMRILAPLCQNCGSIRLPLTQLEGIDGVYEGFAVYPDVDGSSNTLSLKLQESGLSASFPTNPAQEVKNAWSELFAPLPARVCVPWRNRVNDLTGVPLDRAEYAWASYILEESDEIRKASIMKDDSQKLTWEWQDPGEASAILDVLDKAILVLADCDQNGGAGRSSSVGRDAVCQNQVQCRLEIFTTVSAATQAGIKDVAERLANISGTVVTMRNAHKSGLHWLVQDVLPAIRECIGLVSVRISARRFYGIQPGDTSEEGIAIDRPIRYLQELYPADVVVSRELGMGEDHVMLELRDSGPMFQVEGLDSANDTIDTWIFEGWSEQRGYLPCCPGSDQVCIPMSGVRVLRGESIIAQFPVMTDAERIWKWYSETVLPSMKGSLNGNESGHKFQSLDIHVWQDCEDTPIVELEKSSVGEALAEDLYFNTLDAMRQFGKETGDSSWSSPGAVVPFVHERPGRGPAAVVSVLAMRQAGEVLVVKDDVSHRISASWPADRVQLSVSEIAFSNGEWHVRLSGEGWPRVDLESLAHFIVTPLAGEEKPEKREKDMASEVLYPEDVEAIMSQMPGTIILERSYGGSPIWFGECYETLPGYSTSAIKQCLWKPTLFINARHHANEVSSTNSALILMREFHSGVRSLERVNVVLIPLQNVDGARAHAVLCEEHPMWMHHSARYNACGDEFARDYFEPATPYGESRTYTRVWERWRPDMFLDDHGIPSHEWIQPFAGFGSPPLFPVSYWIPQARMYTIWKRIAGRDAEGQAYQQRLEAHVAAYIQGHEDVSAANARMLKRYERWGHQLDPSYFPLTLTNGTLTFANESTVNPESRNPIFRYPDFVTAELVTETDDETVVGADLEERVEAHRVVHRALLDWLTAVPQPLRLSRVTEKNGVTKLTLERPRPLYCAEEALGSDSGHYESRV